MRRGIFEVLLFTAAALISSGCFSLTDPLGREDALEETQREYTKLMRWGEIERASVYVDPALRQEFPIKEEQRWYRDGRTNTWHVRPDMAGLGEQLIR